MGDRLAILIAYSGDGGVEKMMNHLLRGFVDAGVTVDLLLLKARGRHVEEIPAGVNVIRLNVRTSILALPAVARYLRDNRPAALLAAKDRAGRVAILARALAGVSTRLVLRMGMHLSGSLAGKIRLQILARHLPVRWLYPHADAIITVARPVAEDLAAIGRIPESRFHVIANPVLPPSLDELAAAPVEHPWLNESPRKTPVMVAAGRLRPQKGFDLLLEALAEVTRERAVRLLILGEGPDRKALKNKAEELGIHQAVDFVGFLPNPYSIMRAADLFVLSSRFEGAPSVLIEAMALGTPVVATDCPSGPRDILEQGTLGPLVRPGDPGELAQGILHALDAPVSASRLQNAVTPYSIYRSSREYLRVLRLVSGDHPAGEQT